MVNDSGAHGVHMMIGGTIHPGNVDSRRTNVWLILWLSFSIFFRMSLVRHTLAVNA